MYTGKYISVILTDEQNYFYRTKTEQDDYQDMLPRLKPVQQYKQWEETDIPGVKHCNGVFGKHLTAYDCVVRTVHLLKKSSLYTQLELCQLAPDSPELCDIA